MFQHLRDSRVLATLLIVGVPFFCAVPDARGDAIMIDFNTLGTNAGNSGVENHVNAMIGAWGSVNVSGARVLTTYTGDGRAVGPIINGRVQPITLGPDPFLANRSSTDRITMEFDFDVFGVSFDYQIFPDGTRPDGTGFDPETDPNWPDFKLVADGELIFRTLAVMPGEDGTFSHSPFSGPNRVELAPQFIGHSGQITFENGVRTLEFVDWPRTIGIDNLQLITQQQSSPVPEPATLVLLSAGLAGAGLTVRRRRKRERPLAA